MARQKKRRPSRKPEAQYRINQQIRVPEIRLVGENIETGIYPTRKALYMAQNKGLDLVEISPTAKPPVCKIIDYNKFLYEKKRKEKEIKAKTQKTVVKEIRFTPNTDDHDFEFKSKHAQKFLEEGAKVKAYVQFKGRNILFKERGKLLLLKFAQRLDEFGALERMPKLEGKRMFVFMAPKKKAKKPVQAKKMAKKPLRKEQNPKLKTEQALEVKADVQEEQNNTIPVEQPKAKEQSENALSRPRAIRRRREESRETSHQTRQESKPSSEEQRRERTEGKDKIHSEQRRRTERGDNNTDRPRPERRRREGNNTRPERRRRTESGDSNRPERHRRSTDGTSSDTNRPERRRRPDRNDGNNTNRPERRRRNYQSNDRRNSSRTEDKSEKNKE